MAMEQFDRIVVSWADGSAEMSPVTRAPRTFGLLLLA